MRGLLLLPLVLFAAPLRAQTAEPAKEAPLASADAVELARLIGPTSFPTLQIPDADNLKEFKRSLEQTVLAWKGQPCDLDDKRCDAVANDVAEKMLASRKAYMAEVMETIFAVHFQRTLTSTQITQSIALIKTPEGKLLSSAILAASNGQNLREAMNPYTGYLSKTMLAGSSMTKFHEEFFDRTVGLPRSKGPMAPPPARYLPPPPAPTPRPQGGQ